MTAKINYDYFLTFNREKIRNYLKQFNNWWGPLYLLTIFPFLTMHLFESVKAAARYYAVMLPLIWPLIVCQLMPLQLTKIQYLCPLTERERKTYLTGMYLFRIAFPTFLHVAFRLLLIAAGWSNLPETCFELLFFICYAICVNVNPPAPKRSEKHPLRYSGVWCGISSIYGMICTVVYLFVITECSRAAAIWIGSIFLAIQLPLAVRMLLYLKHSVALSLCYESTQKNMTKNKN